MTFDSDGRGCTQSVRRGCPKAALLSMSLTGVGWVGVRSSNAGICHVEARPDTLTDGTALEGTPNLLNLTNTDHRTAKREILGVGAGQNGTCCVYYALHQHLHQRALVAPNTTDGEAGADPAVEARDVGVTRLPGVPQRGPHQTSAPRVDPQEEVACVQHLGPAHTEIERRQTKGEERTRCADVLD